jgi:hypothetical protein
VLPEFSGPLINDADLDLESDLKQLNILDLVTDLNGFLQLNRDRDDWPPTGMAFIDVATWRSFQGTWV